jgi:hypothetical protein
MDCLLPRLLMERMPGVNVHYMHLPFRIPALFIVPDVKYFHGQDIIFMALLLTVRLMLP